MQYVLVYGYWMRKGADLCNLVVCVDLQPLKKGEEKKMRQEKWQEEGGHVACNVRNIENDIVKVEYERLKHNHHQERSLRSVFFVSTCVHRNAHTLS